jgi:hypothetical protein
MPGGVRVSFPGINPDSSVATAGEVTIDSLFAGQATFEFANVNQTCSYTGAAAACHIIVSAASEAKQRLQILPGLRVDSYAVELEAMLPLDSNDVVTDAKMHLSGELASSGSQSVFTVACDNVAGAGGVDCMLTKVIETDAVRVELSYAHAASPSYVAQIVADAAAYNILADSLGNPLCGAHVSRGALTAQLKFRNRSPLFVAFADVLGSVAVDVGDVNAVYAPCQDEKQVMISHAVNKTTSLGPFTLNVKGVSIAGAEESVGQSKFSYVGELTGSLELNLFGNAAPATAALDVTYAWESKRNAGLLTLHVVFPPPETQAPLKDLFTFDVIYYFYGVDQVANGGRGTLTIPNVTPMSVAFSDPLRTGIHDVPDRDTAAAAAADADAWSYVNAAGFTFELTCPRVMFPDQRQRTVTIDKSVFGTDISLEDIDCLFKVQPDEDDSSKTNFSGHLAGSIDFSGITAAARLEYDYTAGSGAPAASFISALYAQIEFENEFIALETSELELDVSGDCVSPEDFPAQVQANVTLMFEGQRLELAGDVTFFRCAAALNDVVWDVNSEVDAFSIDSLDLDVDNVNIHLRGLHGAVADAPLIWAADVTAVTSRVLGLNFEEPLVVSVDYVAGAVTAASVSGRTKFDAIDALRGSGADMNFTVNLFNDQECTGAASIVLPGSVLGVREELVHMTALLVTPPIDRSLAKVGAEQFMFYLTATVDSLSYEPFAVANAVVAIQVFEASTANATAVADPARDTNSTELFVSFQVDGDYVIPSIALSGSVAIDYSSAPDQGHLAARLDVSLVKAPVSLKGFIAVELALLADQTCLAAAVGEVDLTLDLSSLAFFDVSVSAGDLVLSGNVLYTPKCEVAKHGVDQAEHLSIEADASLPFKVTNLQITGQSFVTMSCLPGDGGGASLCSGSVTGVVETSLPLIQAMSVVATIEDNALTKLAVSLQHNSEFVALKANVEFPIESGITSASGDASITLFLPSQMTTANQSGQQPDSEISLDFFFEFNTVTGAMYGKTKKPIVIVNTGIALLDGRVVEIEAERKAGPSGDLCWYLKIETDIASAEINCGQLVMELPFDFSTPTGTVPFVHAAGIVRAGTGEEADNCPTQFLSGSGTLTVSKILSVPDIAFAVNIAKCGDTMRVQTSLPKTSLRMTVGSTHLVLKNIAVLFRQEPYGNTVSISATLQDAFDFTVERSFDGTITVQARRADALSLDIIKGIFFSSDVSLLPPGVPSVFSSIANEITGREIFNNVVTFVSTNSYNGVVIEGRTDLFGAQTDFGVTFMSPKTGSGMIYGVTTLLDFAAMTDLPDFLRSGVSLLPLQDYYVCLSNEDFKSLGIDEFVASFITDLRGAVVPGFSIAGFIPRENLLFQAFATILKPTSFGSGIAALLAYDTMFARLEYDSGTFEVYLRMDGLSLNLSKDLKFTDVWVLVSTGRTGVGFGLAFDGELQTRSNGLVARMSASFSITSTGNIEMELLATAPRPWVNPFGISNKFKLMFPLNLALGINLGVAVPVPYKFVLQGGMEFDGQASSIALSIEAPNISEKGVAVCFKLERFNFGRLVRKLKMGGVLGPLLPVLDRMSTKLTVVKFSSGAVATNFPGREDECATVSPGFQATVEDLKFLGFVMPYGCVRMGPGGFSAFATAKSFSWGPLSVTRSSKTCEPQTGSFPVPLAFLTPPSCAPPPG